MIKLQNNFSLSRQHCIAICFNVLTSESPFYFWKAVMDFVHPKDYKLELNVLSPVDLGVAIHDKIWEKIGMDKVPGERSEWRPRRHQPHNNTRARVWWDRTG